jgi:predicted component of type VI protein secretion system
MYEMDVDPFASQFQRRQKKREEFKVVLRALVEGLASLVEGQRCFAEEFGLSYARVFHDELESFKGEDTCNVISKWLREGEEGAASLSKLFDDLAQHQMALVEAADEVARESIDMAKLSKAKLADKLGESNRTDSKKSKEAFRMALHQKLIMTAFVAGYAKSRERMRANDSDSLGVSLLDRS